MKALDAAGADARLTSDRGLVMDADGLVVPGVGAFRAVMEALRASRGDQLIDRRLAGGQPRARHLRRHAGAVRARTSSAASTPRVSASGRASSPSSTPRCCRTWGGTPSRAGEGSRLFHGIEDERFYFVHSFGAQKWLLDVVPPFPAARADVVRLRRAVPRRRRERTALGDAVPSREVGGCRHPAACELARRARQGYPLNSCLLRERLLP